MEDNAALKDQQHSFKSQIYHAKQGDQIDNALGNFLCDFSKKQKLKILFLRESEGVYKFGQKKVYIKIEKGNKILVKVGGGYLKIEDFIKLYTPEELEKIRRNDVFGRF